MSALGNPEGDGPGGIFLLDHDDFSVKGAWEADRGPQELASDFWWHLNLGTVITSEWGTPNMVEDGLVGEVDESPRRFRRQRWTRSRARRGYGRQSAGSTPTAPG